MNIAEVTLECNAKDCVLKEPAWFYYGRDLELEHKRESSPH